MRKEFTKELIAMLEGASIDDSENRLFVLDPSAFTLLNGVDSETRLALHAAFGLTADASAAIDGWTPSPMSVAYASSCIFSVVNTQRRRPAVASATDYIAWKRVCDISNVSSAQGLLEQAQAEMRLEEGGNAVSSPQGVPGHCLPE